MIKVLKRTILPKHETTYTLGTNGKTSDFVPFHPIHYIYVRYRPTPDSVYYAPRESTTVDKMTIPDPDRRVVSTALSVEIPMPIERLLCNAVNTQLAHDRRIQLWCISFMKGV